MHKLHVKLAAPVELQSSTKSSEIQVLVSRWESVFNKTNIETLNCVEVLGPYVGICPMLLVEDSLQQEIAALDCPNDYIVTISVQKMVGGCDDTEVNEFHLPTQSVEDWESFDYQFDAPAEESIVPETLVTSSPFVMPTGRDSREAIIRSESHRDWVDYNNNCSDDDEKCTWEVWVRCGGFN